MEYAKSLSFIAWAVVTLWTRTLKVRIVNGAIPSRLAVEGRNVVYAFWHGSTFLLPATHQDSGIVVMVSESRDGEIAARMLGHFGFEVVRGSYRRKGNRALIALINRMRRGRSVAITVDGPRGPRHAAKQGVVFLAGEVRAPIVPVATGAGHSWTLERSWDKRAIPAPFSKGVIVYGEPIVVKGTSREEIAAKRQGLTESLHRLIREAGAMAAAAGKGIGSVITIGSSSVHGRSSTGPDQCNHRSGALHEQK
jgi:lysophospholipid acyltransferase (LPLAT)-like uncharacterized protein